MIQYECTIPARSTTVRCNRYNRGNWIYYLRQYSCVKRPAIKEWLSVGIVFSFSASLCLLFLLASRVPPLGFCFWLLLPVTSCFSFPAYHCFSFFPFPVYPSFYISVTFSGASCCLSHLLDLDFCFPLPLIPCILFPTSCFLICDSRFEFLSVSCTYINKKKSRHG